MADTVWSCLVSPTRTFAGMRTRGDLRSPLIFGIVLGSFGFLMNFIWRSAFGWTFYSRMAKGWTGSESASLWVGFVMFLLLPGMVLAWFLISTGAIHLVLIAGGAGRAGPQATFRVIAYTMGATAVLHLVPIVGGVVAIGWCVVISTIGIREIHRTSTATAAAAILLPLVGLAALAVGATILVS